jgi:purine-binding chemotaxis protein CheW
MTGDSDSADTPKPHDSGAGSGPGSDPQATPRAGGSGGSGGSGKGSGRTRGARAGQYICVFWLGGDRYALDAVLVHEVVAVPSLLPVPMTPAWLLGLTNLRGVALAVVDLGGALDLPTRPAAAPGSAGTVVLVLRAHGVTAGIRIDRVEAVHRFEETRLEPRATVDEHAAVKGLMSFTAKGGFTATLLDEERLAARLNELRFSNSAGAA